MGDLLGPAFGQGFRGGKTQSAQHLQEHSMRDPGTWKQNKTKQNLSSQRMEAKYWLLCVLGTLSGLYFLHL
jgi:hypothetical protein